MLGDVLLITEKHENAGKAIFERIIKERKGKYVIAISGESGSGKSELSHVLAKQLKSIGLRAKILHADNYYRIPPLERTSWRKKNGIDNIGYTEYDWDTLNRNVQSFREGSETIMPCIDIITDQVDTLITNFDDVDLLIIDGLYAIKTDDVDLRFGCT